MSKDYNSVLWFGTTIDHNNLDGSDITEEEMIEAVTSRIKDIFEYDDFEGAVDIQDSHQRYTYSEVTE